MISKQEFKVFQKSAFCKRRYRDLFVYSLHHYADTVRRWRWKHGIVLRRASRNQVVNTSTASFRESAGRKDWSGDTEKIINTARLLFKSQYRIPPWSEDISYRAAGGKRLAVGSPADDIQDQHAWHRLYWLLDGQADHAQRLLRLWLAQKPDEIAMHPYTVSERIHNLCEFIGQVPMPDDLTDCLLSQIYSDSAWLSEHIETQLGRHNHVLNNARALNAAAGLFDGDPVAASWSEQARHLWADLWSKLILDDGFFAEQSTFYHVLMTRTLLEYLAEAKRRNWIIPEGFMRQAEKMCHITNLLVRPDGTLPIFGDTSPDMPLEWLRGLPLAARAQGLLQDTVRDQTPGYAGGVSQLIDPAVLSGTMLSEKTTPELGWESQHFADSGFLFCRNSRLDLELTAMGFPGEVLHGHGDTGQGSFEIWWQGRKIVVDGGVPVFGISNTAQHFKGAPGQNCISIGGLSPVPLKSDSDQLPDWYTDIKQHGQWTVSDERAEFRWFGFSRYAKDLLWTRTWKWSRRSIVIVDRISGPSKQVSLTAYLHFGENTWHGHGVNNFNNKDCHLTISTSNPCQINLVNMPYSPNYGVVNDSQGIVVKAEVPLPFELTWEFEFGGNGPES